MVDKDRRSIESICTTCGGLQNYSIRTTYLSAYGEPYIHPNQGWQEARRANVMFHSPPRVLCQHCYCRQQQGAGGKANDRRVVGLRALNKEKLKGVCMVQCDCTSLCCLTRALAAMLMLAIDVPEAVRCCGLPAWLSVEA